MPPRLYTLLPYIEGPQCEGCQICGTMGDTAQPNTTNNVTSIKELKDLDGIINDAFPDTVCANLVSILPYDTEAIMAMFAKRDRNTLKVLRTLLLVQIPKQFKEYAGKTAIDRTSNKLIGQDIIHLGRSIVDNSKSADLATVYRKDNNQTETAIDPANITSLADVIGVIAKLQQDGILQKSEIANLKAESATQKAEIATHKAEIANQNEESQSSTLN